MAPAAGTSVNIAPAGVSFSRPTPPSFKCNRKCPVRFPNESIMAHNGGSAGHSRSGIGRPDRSDSVRSTDAGRCGNVWSLVVFWGPGSSEHPGTILLAITTEYREGKLKV